MLSDFRFAMRLLHGGVAEAIAGSQSTLPKEAAMQTILTSLDTIAPAGVVRRDLVAALAKLAQQDNAVGVISNYTKPAWFDTEFSGSGVSFVPWTGRQDGAVIAEIARHLKVPAEHILVLCSKAEDMQMAKNGGAVLVAAGWSSDERIRQLGIRVKSAAELMRVVELSNAWSGQWWFSGTGDAYNVRVLSDLSSYGASLTQADFSARTVNTVKQGGPELMALGVMLSRSLLVEGVGRLEKTIWGVYPSSKSRNDDSDTLSDFGHRLRTTVSRVQYAKRGCPLFIRHQHSAKRSAGGGVDRTDPSEQIETLHLNPEYQRTLRGRAAIVLDDCTTYGVSFGVAAAFLRRAGVASMIGVALGKFGSRLQRYDIEIIADPFAPISANGYAVRTKGHFHGATNPTAQNSIVKLIK